MATVTASPGEILTVSTDPNKKVKAKIPPYSPIGAAGMNYKSQISGLDMVPILKDLSPNASWLFWTLADNRSRVNNQAVLEAKTLTKYEKQKLSKGYKELCKKGDKWRYFLKIISKKL